MYKLQSEFFPYTVSYCFSVNVPDRMLIGRREEGLCSFVWKFPCFLYQTTVANLSGMFCCCSGFPLGNGSLAGKCWQNVLVLDW